METQVHPRKPYPTDVSDEEWSFVAPYLTLMTEDAPQQVHDLREVFNALRWMVRAGAPWRTLPTNFPPWAAVWRRIAMLGGFISPGSQSSDHRPQVQVQTQVQGLSTR